MIFLKHFFQFSKLRFFEISKAKLILTGNNSPHDLSGRRTDHIIFLLCALLYIVLAECIGKPGARLKGYSELLRCILFRAFQNFCAAFYHTQCILVDLLSLICQLDAMLLSFEYFFPQLLFQ